VHINGLCRTPSKLPGSLATNPRVTIFQATATDTDQIRSALRNASVAICCYLGDPTVMVAGQKTLIDACIAEKVPRYIASDWSLDYRRLELGDLPSKDPMKHIAAYLDVLNACFLEAPWRSLWDAQGQNFKYWGTGEEKWELTSYGTAAEFTARVALDPEATGYLSCKSDVCRIRVRSVEECAVLILSSPR
jgi:NAD(P)H-binding